MFQTVVPHYKSYIVMTSTVFLRSRYVHGRFSFLLRNFLMAMFRAKQDSCGPNGSFYRDRIYELDENSPFVKSGLERGLFESLQPKKKEVDVNPPSPPEIDEIEVNPEEPVEDTPVVAPKRGKR